jgi:hypothetical protein
MKPEREFLHEQASACRQLAMIADPGMAEKLKTLGEEYDTLAEPKDTQPAADVNVQPDI